MKRNAFTPAEMKSFEAAEKIGLVATVNPEGLPHITLITSIMASRPDQITLGQFCQGLSKQHLQQNPKAAFLIMSMDKRLWRGKTLWTHLKKEGPEYERYNDIPMFRYNTYFGINTVHYLDLIETTPAQALPMTTIIISSLLTKIAKSGAKTDDPKPVLNPFGTRLFNRLDALKFLAYIGPDHFPQIIPLLACQAAGTHRLAFSPLAYKAELRTIETDTTVAVFTMNLQMEDVLVRGVFKGYQHTRGINLGLIDLNWVYNSMPPCHGQIYPQTELKPVTDF